MNTSKEVPEDVTQHPAFELLIKEGTVIILEPSAEPDEESSAEPDEEPSAEPDEEPSAEPDEESFIRPPQESLRGKGRTRKQA
jgi:hypothetical protein